jgi:hypothetical protein
MELTREQAIKILTDLLSECSCRCENGWTLFYQLAEKNGLPVDSYCPAFDFEDSLKALGVTQQEIEYATK